MTQLIEFVRTHADLIVQIQALLVVLSGILQTLGFPMWSKLVGTLAVLDLGRVIRQAPRVPPSAGLALLALGIGGCTPAAQNRDCVAAKAADEALAIAIVAKPDSPRWPLRVEALEAATAAVKLRVPQCDLPETLQSRAVLDALEGDR